MWNKLDGAALDKLRSARDELQAENARLRAERPPHMCRDGRPKVRHADSGEDERCPVCRERDRAEAVEAKRGGTMQLAAQGRLAHGVAARQRDEAQVEVAERRDSLGRHAARIAEQAIEIDRLRSLADDMARQAGACAEEVDRLRGATLATHKHANNLHRPFEGAKVPGRESNRFTVRSHDNNATAYVSGSGASWPPEPVHVAYAIKSVWCRLLTLKSALPLVHSSAE